MMQTYPMLIGADRVDSNKPIDVLNPRTEALIGQVFEGSVEQMDDALLAAKEGFSRWSKMALRTENADSSLCGFTRATSGAFG